MQTGRQHSRIFNHGRYAFVLLAITAWIGIPLASAESGSIAEQTILDHEAYLITKINQVPSSISEKEKVLISDEPLDKIFKPHKKISPNSFNYSESRAFRKNPLDGGNTTLPNMPKILQPFGAPVKKAVAPPPPPPKPQPTVDEKEQAAIEQLRQERELEKQRLNQPIVAMSPFLTWVKEHQEEAKALAKKSSQRYAKKPEVIKADDSGGDPFLSIRFPYRGAESPTQGSAAIYSTPER